MLKTIEKMMAATMMAEMTLVFLLFIIYHS